MYSCYLHHLYAFIRSKNKHDAVNNMALRTNENLEDLQAKLEQIESSLEEYKKKQDLCINYKPLRS